MTTALSKRHQARNEKALQELIKTVPGNDRCADCGARNPGTPLLLWRIFCFRHADFSLNRMGQLEREWTRLLEEYGRKMADTGCWVTVGDIFMHAMRLTPSQARYSHFQGQIFEHGQLV